MRSQYEIVASLAKQDRYLQEVAGEPTIELITGILRLCHDHAAPNHSAIELAELILAFTAGWLGPNDGAGWPEVEGSGDLSWLNGPAE